MVFKTLRDETAEKNHIAYLQGYTPQWICSLKLSLIIQTEFLLTASYAWLKVLIHIPEIEDWSLSFFN